MRVSVVIPAKNEERTLLSCLSAIQDQTHDDIEVFVVDDGSTDATGAIARAFAAGDDRFVVLRTDGIGPSAARNLAIARATGEVVAFIDADAIPRPDWIAALLEALPDDTEVVGVGGAQVVPDDATPFERTVARFLRAVGFVSEYVRTNASVASTRHNPSCNSLYRLDALRATGGFRAGLFPCEDLDLDKRLRDRGGRLLFTPRAVVAHHRPRTPRDFARMMRSYGHGHGQLVRIHGPYRLLHVMPFVTFFGVVAFLALPIPTLVAAAPLGAAAFGALTVRTRSPVEATRFSAMLAVALAEWHIGFVSGLRLPP